MINIPVVDTGNAQTVHGFREKNLHLPVWNYPGSFQVRIIVIWISAYTEFLDPGVPPGRYGRTPVLTAATWVVWIDHLKRPATTSLNEVWYQLFE